MRAHVATALSVLLVALLVHTSHGAVNLNPLQSTPNPDYDFEVSGGNPLRFGYSTTIQNATQDSTLW